MSILEDLKLQYQTGGFAQKLIFWNVGLFAIPLVLKGLLYLFQIDFKYIHYFHLSSQLENLIYKPWTIITYGFFHGDDFFHLLFNMIFLYFFSQLFKTFFTEKQMIDIYFSGVIFSGIIFLISSIIFPVYSFNMTLVGASGAIMSLLLATTTFSPNFGVRLLLIGQVKLWHITVFFIILDFIQLSSSNSAGHIAHLGGALFGYLYVKQMQQGKNIALPFNDWYLKISNYFKPSQKVKTPFKTVYKNTKPTDLSNSSTNKSLDQKKIDDILDKISASGYDSLTKAEKEFLFNHRA